VIPTRDAATSRADVSANQYDFGPLPNPEFLTNAELVAWEAVLTDHVQEVARAITERILRVAAGSGLDLVKLLSDPESNEKSISHADER
jgi:hypothetical protein